MSIELCVLSFFLYSFFGWVYESTICSLLKQKRFINRGFLIGPWCPIYGCGAVMCYLILNSIENSIILFIAASILCSVLEYITGYGMEKLFYAKWWDYSHYPFNLNGRICLYGAILFGTVSVIVCKVIQPKFIRLFENIDFIIPIFIVIFLCVIFVFDIVVTLQNWVDFNTHLKNMQEIFLEKVNQKYDDISDLYQSKIQPRIVANKNGLEVWVSDKKTQFKKRELRFLHAFPKLKIKSHEIIIRKIEMRSHIKNVFGKWL